MTKIFHSFPAYDVVEGELNRHGILRLRANDELALVNEPTSHHKVGSVVSFALANGLCPIKQVEQAKDRGHPLHYAFALGATIHNGPFSRTRYIGVELGQVVEFEGRYFRIEAARNRNIKLTELDRSEYCETTGIVFTA